MSKTSEMEATIRELRGIASSINDIANWLTGAFSGSEEAAPAPEPEKALTLEEVRAILAEKSRDGFTAQIRDLLLKYSAKKLSEVDPASYKALVADAEVLGNAIKRRDSKYITAALKEAHPMVEIDQRQLDADEFLLNTPSATYDLRISFTWI